jgi:hypothetical protein
VLDHGGEVELGAEFGDHAAVDRAFQAGQTAGRGDPFAGGEAVEGKNGHGRYSWANGFSRSVWRGGRSLPPG